MKHVLWTMFIVVTFMTSCSVYAPNTLNVPMLKEKGEFQAGVHVGNGINVHTSYALTDRVGIMANYMNIGDETTTNEIKREGSGSLFEGGLGYYSSFGSNNHFETFGGYGFGKVTIERINSTLNQTKTLDVKANRFFVQPAIGVAGKHFEINLASRVSFLKYNSFKSSYSQDELAADNFVDIEGPTWIFLEPALTIRAGLQNLKFQIQFGRSFKLNNQELGYEKGMLSLGVIARL